MQRIGTIRFPYQGRWELTFTINTHPLAPLSAKIFYIDVDAEGTTTSVDVAATGVMMLSSFARTIVTPFGFRFFFRRIAASCSTASSRSSRQPGTLQRRTWQ